ncbi:MAG: class I SAM-dependent methyltransferase [Planctomycetota bacterium]|jgi:ubiquinone/menaquinone biosynthesis C-methylase UbiE
MPHINWNQISYHWHFIRKLESEFIIDRLSKTKPNKIIDIACGDGQLSDLIVQKAGLNVFGVDLNKNLVLNQRPSSCQKLIANAELSLADVHALPFYDGSFGAAVCNCSLEHFGNVSRVLSEIRRVLAPAGFLFGTVDSFTTKFVTPEMKQVHAEKYHVENYFSKQSLARLLEQHGFLKARMRYYLSSYISHIFFKFFSSRGFQGRLFETFSPLVYHLSKISDKFVGQDAGGYGLAFSCRKYHENER